MLPFYSEYFPLAVVAEVYTWKEEKLFIFCLSTRIANNPGNDEIGLRHIKMTKEMQKCLNTLLNDKNCKWGNNACVAILISTHMSYSF